MSDGDAAWWKRMLGADPDVIRIGVGVGHAELRAWDPSETEWVTVHAQRRWRLAETLLEGAQEAVEEGDDALSRSVAIAVDVARESGAYAGGAVRTEQIGGDGAKVLIAPAWCGTARVRALNEALAERLARDEPALRASARSLTVVFTGPDTGAERGQAAQGGRR